MRLLDEAGCDVSGQVTLIDGRTGETLKTVDYIPSREPIDGWGGIGGNGGLLSGNAGEINPRSIIDYYALRLAENCGMPLTVRKDGDDIVFSAKTLR